MEKEKEEQINTCLNCEHRYVSVYKEPCNICSPKQGLQNWEPMVDYGGL